MGGLSFSVLLFSFRLTHGSSVAFPSRAAGFRESVSSRSRRRPWRGCHRSGRSRQNRQPSPLPVAIDGPTPAQFEREVTSERIRDKIAASKRKGLWVGGPLPLGYQMKDDKIAVVEDEAERVRLIFHRYLELGGVNALARDLRQVSPTRALRTSISWSSIVLWALARTSRRPLPMIIDTPLARLDMTVNSDDPAYFGGYVNQNYRAVSDALGLHRDEIVTIVRNGIQASLMTPSEKNEAFAEINRILATIA
jgi:hypothetical protein